MERGRQGRRLERDKRRRLPSKAAFRAPAGARLRIETPGGGGWGRRR
ncbi:MAG: hydantoinase B/oxoprolinase family protein [Dehalococcoidia bacterium]